MDWKGKERRRFVRISLPLEIYILKSKSNLPAKTINVSAGGLRLHLTKKFPVGSLLDLDIYGVTPKPLVCQGKVIWVCIRKRKTPHDLFDYDTGLEFYKLKKESFYAIEKMISDCLSLK